MRGTLAVALAVALALPACRPAGRPAPPPPPPKPAPPPPAADPSEAAWARLETLTSEMVRSREYGAALRALDSEARVRPELAERVAKLREVVLASARGEFAAGDRKAREALERGDEDAAIALWTGLLAFDDPEFTDAARQSIHEAEAARFRRTHEDAMSRLGPVLVELRALLLARDDAGAKALLRRVATDTPALVHEMAWLEGTVIESEGVLASVEEGLRRMKGEHARVGDADVTIAGAASGDAVFDRPSDAPLRVPLPQLPPALFLEAGLRGGHSVDFVGQYLLFTGHIPEARAAFEKSPNAALLKTLADSVEESLRKSAR